MINYAVLIVTFNRKELLVEAINSVLNQTFSSEKIIIVDNASTDNTEQYLLENGILDNSNIVYLRLDENIGGSGGFYTGLEYIVNNLDVSWISLSDDDAIYATNYFETIFNSKNFNEDILALSGKVIFPDGEIQLGHKKFIANNERLSANNIPIDMYQKNEFFVDFASFVGTVVSTDLVKKIGLPSKEYFIWYDDLEYSLRMKKETKILINSNAVIVHKTKKALHGNKKSIGYNWKNYYGIRNRIQMIREHSKHRNLGTFYVIISVFFNVVKQRIEIKDQSIRRRIFKQTRSAVDDGLRGRMGKNDSYLP